MREGFTMVEVLVAAVIASFAGMALLQTNNSNTLLFSKLKSLSESTEELSLVATHADKRFNRSNKSLYDILDRQYDIQNDDFRKYLKETKYDYTETLIDTIIFGDDGEAENSEDTNMLYEENSESVPTLQFELIKISIRNETSHGAIIKIRPLL